MIVCHLCGDHPAIAGIAAVDFPTGEPMCAQCVNDSRAELLAELKDLLGADASDGLIDSIEIQSVRAAITHVDAILATAAINRGATVTTTKDDGTTWIGTVVIVRSDGTALVKWTAPMLARSIDFPVAELSVIGWCHVCNRDIRTIADHADECPVKDRGPEHPEIAPTTTCAQCGVDWASHPAGDGLTECPGDFPCS